MGCHGHASWGWGASMCDLRRRARVGRGRKLSGGRRDARQVPSIVIPLFKWSEVSSFFPWGRRTGVRAPAARPRSFLKFKSPWAIVWRRPSWRRFGGSAGRRGACCGWLARWHAAALPTRAAQRAPTRNLMGPPSRFKTQPRNHTTRQHQRSGGRSRSSQRPRSRG